MKTKLKVCKYCGEELAHDAKFCPNCGGKNKKPFYKRVWFIVPCAFFILCLIGIGQESDEAVSSKKPTETNLKDEAEIVYDEVTADDLINLMDDNPLKAEKLYNDKYLKITGRLSNIDSDGSYISLDSLNGGYSFVGITCYIKEENQLLQVMELKLDDTVTIYGKVTDIGELLGYNIEIIKIEL